MAKKILAVDDEKDLRNLIKRVLIRAKYDVITANNGKEGLTKLYDEAPDMVILDVNMPEMDGWETCQEIRKDPLYKHLPIIMLTVRKTEKDQIKLKWIFEDGSSEKTIQEDLIKPDNNGSGQIVVSLAKEDNGFENGNYKAVLSLNDSQNLTKKFTVK